MDLLRFNRLYDDGDAHASFNYSIRLVVDRNLLTAWCAVNLAVSLFGTILCFVLLMGILTDRAVRSGAGFLICHLLILDIAMFAVNLPINTIWAYTESYRLDARYTCPYVMGVFLSTMYTGYWLSFFIAVNRFIAVMVPQKYRKWSSSKVLRRMIAASWFIGFGCTLPLSLGFGGYFDLVPPWANCGVRMRHDFVYPLSKVAGVYIPLVSVCSLYVAMFSVLVKSRSHRLADETGNLEPALVSQERIYRHRIAISRMLFVSSIWHCSCYFPYIVIVSSYREQFLQDPLLDLLLRTLFHFGYAVNPVIFLVMSQSYRKSIANLTIALCRGSHTICGFLESRRNSAMSTASRSTGVRHSVTVTAPVPRKDRRSTW